MLRTFALLAVVSILFVGCHKQQAAKQSGSPPSEQSIDWTRLDASPEAKQFITELAALVDRYNKDAKGVKLSDHGVKGNLSEADAARMAQNANSILDEINALFTTPVCCSIGDTWYQVPARFTLTPASGNSDQDPQRFTISHHNCGLYEFDFAINVDGLGDVVAERYDDLGVLW